MVPAYKTAQYKVIIARMKKSAGFWLLLILIISLFLRTYHLDSLPPGLYPDEAMNGNNALEALRDGGFKAYYPENNGREGLFINIQALFLKALLPLTGGAPEPWMLRLPSAIFGTLTVLGMFHLGKTLFSEPAGLLSAFFLGTSFWHILFSRIGFRAILAPLLLVWGLYFLITAIRNGQASNRRWIFLGILGGTIYGLGFHTYIAYRISPILLFLFVPFFGKTPNFWRILGLFLAAAFVAALPMGLYYLGNPADFLGRTSQISVFSSESPIKDLAVNSLKTLGMFHFAGDYNWRHNYAGRPELFLPVGFLFLLGLFAGIRNLSAATGEKKFSLLLPFFWIVLAALPVVISNEGLPHALRAILMAPPIFLLAGAGGKWLYDFLASRISLPLLKKLSLVFFGLLVIEAAATYFVRWGRNPNTPGAFSADYVELGKALNRLPRETIKYVVVGGGGVPVNGIPMPAQTVMYITDTYSSERQRKKNIYYLPPEDESRIPIGSLKFRIFRLN